MGSLSQLCVIPALRRPACALLGLVLLVCSAGLSADQDSDNSTAGGLNVSVELRHRVIIPKILYFRVGSPTPGTVDRVTIDLQNNPSPIFDVGNDRTYNATIIPLGNSVPIEASSNGELVVDVRSNVGTVNISYSVPANGLSAGGGLFIPFSEIETIASDAALPAPELDNAGATPGSPGSVNIAPNGPFGWVVNRQGTWRYRYRNIGVYQAGTYDGRVTYTASAP